MRPKSAAWLLMERGPVGEKGALVLSPEQQTEDKGMRPQGSNNVRWPEKESSEGMVREVSSGAEEAAMGVGLEVMSGID
jgi:hypothetical protein